MRTLICVLSFLFSNIALAGNFIVSTPTQARIVPVSLPTCTDLQNGGNSSSLLKNALNLSQFGLAWHSDDNNSFTPAYFTLEINHPSVVGGTYLGIVTDEEMALVLGNQSSLDSDTAVRAACAPRFGGIQFVDNAAARTIKGTFKVVGSEVDSNGAVQAVSASHEIVLVFYGDPSARH
jgi:hypothetical protein